MNIAITRVSTVHAYGNDLQSLASVISAQKPQRRLAPGIGYCCPIESFSGMHPCERVLELCKSTLPPFDYRSEERCVIAINPRFAISYKIMHGFCHEDIYHSLHLLDRLQPEHFMNAGMLGSADTLIDSWQKPYPLRDQTLGEAAIFMQLEHSLQSQHAVSFRHVPLAPLEKSIAALEECFDDERKIDYLWYPQTRLTEVVSKFATRLWSQGRCWPRLIDMEFYCGQLGTTFLPLSFALGMQCFSGNHLIMEPYQQGLTFLLVEDHAHDGKLTLH